MIRDGKMASNGMGMAQGILTLDYEAKGRGRSRWGNNSPPPCNWTITISATKVPLKMVFGCKGLVNLFWSSVCLIQMSYLHAPNRREVCLKLPVSIIRRGSVPMNMIMVAYPYPLLIINISLSSSSSSSSSSLFSSPSSSSDLWEGILRRQWAQKALQELPGW